MYSLLWSKPRQPEAETSNIERVRKTAIIRCCMVCPKQLNDIEITPSWGSVQTLKFVQTVCLNDATTTPSVSDDEPYEC